MSQDELKCEMSSSLLTKLKPVVILPSLQHTASVILLHGSGSNGEDLRDWFKMCLQGQDMVEPHIKFIYPTAPLRPYTAAYGMMSNVWFDRYSVTPGAAEHTESMEAMCKELSKFLDAEVNSGTPRNRIVLGGFSMGGALALYYGLQYGSGLAGIFCLSSFLSETSHVFEKLKSTNVAELPPVFQAHGNKDNLVLPEWGKTTNEKIRAAGVKTVFHEYENLYHQLSTKEVKEFRQWLHRVLPQDV